jgi:hypothetical protein
MVKYSDLPPDTAGETRFRRGFTHGVQEVLRAVEGHLTAAQLQKLRHWAQTDVREWASAGGDATVEPPGAPEI